MATIDELLKKVMKKKFDLTVPNYAMLIGIVGVASAAAFSMVGAAYGMVKCGVALATLAERRPKLAMRCTLPAVLAFALGILGWLVAVLLIRDFRVFWDYTLYSAYVQLGAGLTMGLSAIGAGYAIGVVGDAGLRAMVQQPRVFLGMMLILLFAETLCIVGMIGALYLHIYK